MQGGLVQIMCNIIKCSIVVTLIVQSIYSTEIKNGKLLYSEKEIGKYAVWHKVLLNLKCSKLHKLFFASLFITLFTTSWTSWNVMWKISYVSALRENNSWEKRDAF